MAVFAIIGLLALAIFLFIEVNKRNDDIRNLIKERDGVINQRDNAIKERDNAIEEAKKLLALCRDSQQTVENLLSLVEKNQMVEEMKLPAPKRICRY